jgi:hypothetical protein
MQKVFVYYYLDKEKNTYYEQLTTDENEAKEISPDYELASIEHLIDWIAVGVTFTDTIIQVKEGYCKWYERELEDQEIDFGYEIITEYILSEPA